MIKKLLVVILITGSIVFSVATTLANEKISRLEAQNEAHKLAMSYANAAIHTLYDETLFLKDKGISL